MALSAAELSNIKANGFEISKSNLRELDTSKDPSLAFIYIFKDFGHRGKNLAVFFEIDSRRLTNVEVEGMGLTTTDNIPKDAIKRIMIFDPQADLTNLPFVEMRK